MKSLLLLIIFGINNLICPGHSIMDEAGIRFQPNLKQYAPMDLLHSVAENNPNYTYHKKQLKSKIPYISNHSRPTRETTEFTWKPSKTPSFITKGDKPSVEPILRVYPDTYRTGRSRELPQQRTGTRRIIYYATLPDVVRYPIDTRQLKSNQQRSFDPKSKDFVTRVQSSIIDVRPSAEKESPKYTIVDAEPPYRAGYNDRFGAEYLYPTVDKTPYYPQTQYQPQYVSMVHNQYPNTHYVSSQYHKPYYNQVDKAQQYQVTQYQQQYQASPYYGDFSRIPYNQAVAYYTPPYPTRHNRFPPDRYSVSSPLASIGLSNIMHSKPERPTPASIQSNIDYNNYHSLSHPTLGYDSPSSIPTLTSNFDLGPSSFQDSNFNFDDQPNKFSDYNSFLSTTSPLSQKYMDLSSINPDFPYKYSTKVDPFKNKFNVPTDWLTNKPLDLSSFDLDDFESNRDFHIKRPTLVSTSMDSSRQNNTDDGNTVITPYTSLNESAAEARTKS